MSRQDTEESTAADLAAAAPERANSATRTFFRGRFTFQFGQPLVISEREEIVPPFTEEQSALGRQIGLTFKAYREAAKSLLVEKYQALREIVPPHLRSECDCLVIVCDDGVVVRYDRQTGDAPKVRTGIIEDSDRSVTAVAPKLSEQYVFFPLDPTGFELPPEGPRLQLFTISGTTGERTLLADARLGIVVPWGELRQQPPAPARPVPLVSVTNEFDFLTQGELFNEGDEARPGTGQPFVTRSHVKLAVGWETIEVYPPFDPGVWQPSVAPLWAELDLLAAATRRNQQDQQF